MFNPLNTILERQEWRWEGFYLISVNSHRPALLGSTWFKLTPHLLLLSQSPLHLHIFSKDTIWTIDDDDAVGDVQDDDTDDGFTQPLPK